MGDSIRFADPIDPAKQISDREKVSGRTIRPRA
jgi:hypothetical protein